MSEDNTHKKQAHADSKLPDDHETDDGHSHAHNDFLNRTLGGRAEIIFAVLCGICLLLGRLRSKYSILSEQFGFGLSLAAYFFGGYFTLREAVEKIAKGQFQIDFLMLVDSYRCSRYNVNTGVLTEEMFLSAVARVRDEVIR